MGEHVVGETVASLGVAAAPFLLRLHVHRDSLVQNVVQADGLQYRQLK